MAEQHGGKMDIDRALKLLGKPGRFTVFIYAIGFMTNAFVAFNHVSLPSLYATPVKHRCAMGKGFQNFSSAEESPGNTSFTEIENFKCYYSLRKNQTELNKKCPKWDFIYSHGKSRTWASQWNLVCEEKYMLSLGQSLYMVGVMIGSALSGMASDHFGRRPVLLICLLISSILSILLPFIPDVISAIAIRLLMGLSIAGVHGVVYILPTELTTKAYMGILSVAMMNSFIAAVFVGCIFVFAIRDWQIVQLALCGPSILLLVLTYFFLPESPRWALVNKKNDVLENFFERAKKFNKLGDIVNNEIDEILVQLFADGTTTHAKKRKYSSTDLFKTPRMRKRSLIGIYLWFTAGVSYYALSYNMPNLHGNPFLAIFLGAATDLPSFILAFWYIPRYGKRKSLIVVMVMGGLFCLVFKFYSSLVILLIGKTCVAVSFGIVFIYLPEIYPTVIRNIGIGTLSFFARLGSVLAPQIVLIGESTSPDVPVIVVGCMAIIGGLLALAAPETKGKDLPVLIEDVELKRTARERPEGVERDDSATLIKKT